MTPDALGADFGRRDVTDGAFQRGLGDAQSVMFSFLSCIWYPLYKSAAKMHLIHVKPFSCN